MKIHFDKIHSQRGMSIIELLVVVFIISIITGIVVASFRAGDKTKSLRLGSEEILSLIREAQSKSLLGQSEAGNSFPKGGYGIFFEKNLEYCILFGDYNNNREYDGVRVPPFEGKEYLKHIKLRGELTVEKIVKSEEGSLNKLSIVFVPPRPTLYYDKSDDVVKGEIFLGIASEPSKRKILINCISGQVDLLPVGG